MDPTLEQCQRYVKWYNALPSRLKAIEPWDGKPWRRECPVCREPQFAKINEYGEVCMDMIHKETCALLIEHGAEWDRENARIQTNLDKIRKELANERS